MKVRSMSLGHPLRDVRQLPVLRCLSTFWARGQFFV